MQSFEVCVVGGGPAGMMAAGRAGELGVKTVLLEKNKKLGKKLLLTGKGRCNLTNATFNLYEFVSEFGEKGDFLYSPLSRFGVKETMEFFEKKGLPLKVERGDRVFPASEKAEDVLAFFKNYLKKNKVEIVKGVEVKGLKKEKERIEGLKPDLDLRFQKIIVATGGLAYPGTGSTGQAIEWAENLGHTIIKPRPALVPLKTKEEWPKELEGLDLKNVNLTLFQNGKEVDERFGDMVFTSFGASGPIVLDLSRKAAELLEKGEVKLVLDLKPALSFEKLDKRLVRDFKKYHAKYFKNALSGILPSKLIPVFVELSGVPARKPAHQITREERLKIGKKLKGLEMTVEETLGFDQAIVSTGGVSTDEVDQKTMRSKKIKNLYFAGEILSLAGPTGGYNLQVAWTTGRVAGQSAATIK